MKLVYAITWKYRDGSDSGIVRVCESQERAEEDKAVLIEYGDYLKSFQVVEVSFCDR